MRLTSRFWQRARIAGGPVRLTRRPPGESMAPVPSGPRLSPPTGVPMPPPSPPRPPIDAPTELGPFARAYRPMGVNQALMARIASFGGMASMGPGAVSAPMMMGSLSRTGLPSGAPYFDLACNSSCAPEEYVEEEVPPFRIG